MHNTLRTIGFLGLAIALMSGCGDDAASGADAAPSGPDSAVVPDAAGGGEDLDMKASDFECVLRWDKVRNFRITNKLGHKAEALAVANNVNGGMEYPVGTIIQLVPFEAMVKRAKGWNLPSGDWEFFALGVSGSTTTIDSRGNATVNFQGKQCLDCHAKTMPAFDFVCEKTHGCDPLGIGDDVILQFQNADSRCP